MHSTANYPKNCYVDQEDLTDHKVTGVQTSTSQNKIKRRRECLLILKCGGEISLIRNWKNWDCKKDREDPGNVGNTAKFEVMVKKKFMIEAEGKVMAVV